MASDSPAVESSRRYQVTRPSAWAEGTCPNQVRAGRLDRKTPGHPRPLGNDATLTAATIAVVVKENTQEDPDNFVPAPEFAPALRSQVFDIRELRADATRRGWTSEVERHGRVIESLEAHLAEPEDEPDSEGAFDTPPMAGYPGSTEVGGSRIRSDTRAEEPVTDEDTAA